MSNDFDQTTQPQPPQPHQLPYPQQPPVIQESRSGRGCLYGCLFIVFAGIALLVCGGFGLYWVVSGQVKKYTSPAPADLPTVEFSAEDLQALETRVESFTEGFEEDKTPENDLELTAEEINALISKDDNLKGKVFIRIADGQVSGDLSIPTDVLPGGKGRYFNGSASLDVSMEDGILIVTLADAEVNGQPVPQEIIDGMAQQNLAKDLYEDPKVAKTLRKMESVSIEGDKIILKVKRDPPAEEPQETPSDETPSDGDPSDGDPSDETPSNEDPSDGDQSGESASSVETDVTGGDAAATAAAP